MTALLTLALACHAPVSRQGPALSATLSSPEQSVADPTSVLTAAAAELDPAVRAEAVAALITSSAEPGGGPWGPRGVWDPNPWVQRRALDALATRLPEDESHVLIVSVLGRAEVDAYTRGQAAFWLAKAPVQADRAAVHAAWTSLGSSWQAASPALGAAMMGDDGALAEVSQVLRQGTLPLDLDFLHDVGRSGLVALIPPLREALSQVEPELRLSVAGALLALGDEGGVPVLSEALGDPEQRLSALDVLVQVPSKPVIPLLDDVARGPDGMAATYARLALTAWFRHDSEPFVLAAASSDREARALAMRFVGVARTIGEPNQPRKWQRAVHIVLLAGMQDVEPGVRRAAALAASADEAQQLEALLQDDDVGVRVAAARRVLAVRPALDVVVEHPI